MVSLGAANARQPAVIGMLASIRIDREESAVRVSLSAPVDALVKLVFPR